MGLVVLPRDNIYHKSDTSMTRRHPDVTGGPSGATPRYLSSLFDAGTASGLRDCELLDRFLNRRGPYDDAAEIAFAALVERHGPMVLGTCRAVLADHHQAEDAFQATFLVLANRAHAVQRDRSLAAWLYGVAVRVAGCARSRNARRQRHERRFSAMTRQSRDNGDGARASQPFDDLGSVLHEEIGRLPAKYRTAVVSCYLQGLTHDQAADQLGWPVGTVRSRLARARDRLRIRLTRRGLAPSVLPGVLSGSGPARDLPSVNMSVPAALAEATVRGAMRAGLGSAAVAGLVSANAVILMRSALRAMIITKLTFVTTAILTSGLIMTGARLTAYSGQGQRNAVKSGGVNELALRESGQEKTEKPAADPKTPEDQLDTLLREVDATLESNRRSAPRGNIPAEKQAQVQANFDKLRGIKGRLLDLATRYPRTNAAEQALVFLAAEVSFNPAASKARELLARDYARSDRLKVLLTRRLELYWASQAVEDLLRNVLEQNPYREIRGLACYWLAEVLTYRSQMLRLWPIQSPRITEMWRQRFSPQDFERVEKQDPKSLEGEIARLYERVINEFAFVQNNDTRTERPPFILGQMAGDLPAVAGVHLDELRRFSTGKPAPEIQGIDLDGKPLKLTDYRGKVVVLFVSGFGRPFTAPPERAPAFIVGIFRQLAKTNEGKPVAFLGVVETFREEYKKEVETAGLPIRFWWDPSQERAPERAAPGLPASKPGPILTAWDAEVPNWYVIDQRGVIRYTQVFGVEMLEKAVTTVLNDR